MANTFSPFGFQDIGRADGASWIANRRAYQILYSNSHKLYTGDICVMLSTGYIDTLSPGTTPPLGIFVGCEYYSASQNKMVQSPFYPGNGDTVTNGIVTAFVLDDPSLEFLVQTGWSAGSPIPAPQAWVGMNAQYANGTGSSLTGLSGAYLDVNTTPTTTSTFPFRILSLVGNPPGANGSDATTAYNYVKVAWNNQFYKQLTGI